MCIPFGITDDCAHIAYSGESGIAVDSEVAHVAAIAKTTENAAMSRFVGDSDVIKSAIVAKKIAAKASVACITVLGIILASNRWDWTPHVEVYRVQEFEIDTFKGVACIHLIRQLDKVTGIVDFIRVGLSSTSAAESAVGPHCRGHGEEHGRHSDECSPECLLVSH